MNRKVHQYSQFKQSLQKAIESIKKNKSGVFLVYGNCDKLVQLAKDAILRAIKDFSNAETTVFETKDLKETSPSDLVESSSLFSDLNIYVFKQFEFKKNTTPFIEAPLESKIRNNIYLFLCETERIPPKTKKSLEKSNAISVLCQQPAPFEIKDFISDTARKLNLKITEPSANLIIDYVGFDCSKITNELVKISTFFSNKREPLHPADISTILGTIKEEHAFEIEKHLLANNPNKAGLLLGDLFQRGNSMIALLGIISNFCRKSIKVDQLQTQGHNEHQIASKVHLPLSVVRKYINFNRKNSRMLPFNILKFCQDADIRLKSTSTNGEILFMQLTSLLKE